MFVIVNGDGDIDYVTVYGPYDSHEEADEVLQLLPNDSSDDKWRIEEVLPPSAIEEYYA